MIYQVLDNYLASKQFFLALASPVLHKMLCGSFSESKEKKLKLEDVVMGASIETLDIWSGRVEGQEMAPPPPPHPNPFVCCTSDYRAGHSLPWPAPLILWPCCEAGSGVSGITVNGGGLVRMQARGVCE